MTPSVSKVIEIFRKNYDPIPLEVFEDPYKILISTMLSSRTKDEITLEASERLFKKAQNVNNLLKLHPEDVEKLIYPVGFYKTKSKYLINLAKKLVDDFHSKVPDNREDLMSLPGVGRKTANLVLNRAFNIPAIAVDTHVHRITNLLSWVSTKTPRETEDKLCEIVDQRYWSELNKLFVSIGRKYSTGSNLKGFLKENDLIE